MMPHSALLAGITTALFLLSTPFPPASSSPSPWGRFPLLASPLRLRGGHRNSGFRKASAVNKKLGFSGSKRIHSAMRPHAAKRREERRAARGYLERAEEVVEVKEVKQKRRLRKLRLGERKFGDAMASIEAYKVSPS